PARPRSSNILPPPCRTTPAISIPPTPTPSQPRGLLPDIQLASSRFAKLAEAERAGSLTGTSGSGTVVQLLTQMSGQLHSLGQEVRLRQARIGAVRAGQQESGQDARIDFGPWTDFNA